MTTLRTSVGTFAIVIALGAPYVAASSATLGPSGYAGIKPGMTLAQASAAFGTAFVLTANATPAETRACTYAFPRNRPRQPALMVVNGRVARIDVSRRAIAADNGILVGDPVAKIRARFGRANLVETPHTYDPRGTYIEVTPDQGSAQLRLLFETSKGRVTQFRSGRLPEVRYIEGCS